MASALLTLRTASQKGVLNFLTEMCHEEHREKMLHDLMAVDFVLLELNLYLDTHPNDRQAIQQFNDMAARRKQLSEQYERHFGPLMNFGHSTSKAPWEWKDGPWPWQM